jgi:hypothetical protein
MEAINLLVFVFWWWKTRRSHGYKNLQGGHDIHNQNWTPGANIGGAYT